MTMNPAESSIPYLADAPEAAPQAAQDALADFDAKWSEHHGDLAVLLPTSFNAFTAYSTVAASPPSSVP